MLHRFEDGEFYIPSGYDMPTIWAGSSSGLFQRFPHGLVENDEAPRGGHDLCKLRDRAHAPQIKKKTPPDKLRELLFYAGGGGLPRTERQPAGLIARPAKQGRAVRPAHTPQIKKKTPPDKLREFLFYAGGGGRTHTCY